jgi:hypothetical protein
MSARFSQCHRKRTQRKCKSAESDRTELIRKETRLSGEREREREKKKKFKINFYVRSRPCSEVTSPRSLFEEEGGTLILLVVGDVAASGRKRH